MWMSHGRSLVAILVAMQWANKDVFNSGSDILCNVNVGLREGGEEIYMHVDTDMHIYIYIYACMRKGNSRIPASKQG